MEDYEYPYGEMQVHEALEDLDRRLKALEPKAKQGEPAKPNIFAPTGEPAKPVI